MTESQQDREPTQIANIMKREMRTDVEKRFSFFEREDLYRDGTYIDPRYEIKYFSSCPVTDQVNSSLARVCEEINKLTIVEEEKEEPRKKLRRDDLSKTPTTCKTLDEAMTSIIAFSSDEEAEADSVARNLHKTLINITRRKESVEKVKILSNGGRQ